MLEIRINNEVLDLAEDAELQMEMPNPFLQFQDVVIDGSYSFPFQVKYTEKNMRLLQYSNIFQKQVSIAGINASVFESGLFIFAGKIKVERVNININNHQATFLDCYFVSDAADFYQDAKDVRMRDIDAGGTRSFLGTDASPWYNSQFGVHVESVAKGIGGPYDYAFFPVKNSSWGLDPGVLGNDGDVMNKVYQTASGMRIGPILVPFPYLKYILVQAVEHVGWTIEGSILDDVDFNRIVLINFRAIDWANFRETGGITYELDPMATVTFDLKNHLPNIGIGEFLIALKNRFGWWYDFDSNSKIITINKLADVPNGIPKDIKSWCNPLVPKPVLQENAVYALRNNFITNGGDGIDISKLDYRGAVDGVADLPAAAQSLNEQVYLVEEENNYYACLQNPNDEAVWEWQIISYNIYDYAPAGVNKDITTTATTVGVAKYDDYMDMIPVCEGIGIWKDFTAEDSWGIHLCFNLGWIVRKLGPSGGFAYKYPQATHHLYDTLGNQLTQWSLAFKGQKTDGTQVGFYDLNWKSFLDMLTSSESADLLLYPTRVQYLQLQWQDILMIDGVRFFIEKRKAGFPWKNKLEATANRLS